MPKGTYKCAKNGSRFKAQQMKNYQGCCVCSNVGKKMIRIAHKDRTQDNLDRLYCAPCFYTFTK